MNFEIRKATPDDAAQIARVHDTSRRKAYAEILTMQHLNAMTLEERTKFWRDRVLLSATDDRTIFVAADAATICGFIAVEAQRGRNWGEVDRIYVMPDTAQKGIGRELIKTGVDHLRDYGFEKVVLWVLEGNTAAQGFYAKVGFKPDGAQRKWPTFPKELRYSMPIEPW